jgi:hypothetical protein
MTLPPGASQRLEQSVRRGLRFLPRVVDSAAHVQRLLVRLDAQPSARSRCSMPISSRDELERLKRKIPRVGQNFGQL